MCARRSEIRSRRLNHYIYIYRKSVLSLSAFYILYDEEGEGGEVSFIYDAAPRRTAHFGTEFNGGHVTGDEIRAPITGLSFCLFLSLCFLQNSHFSFFLSKFLSLQHS